MKIEGMPEGSLRQNHVRLTRSRFTKQQPQDDAKESSKRQAYMQSANADGARKAIANGKRPERIHIMMHEAIEQNVRKAPD